MEEQFGWRVAEQCPNAIRILDTEDLHCLRKGRQQAFKGCKPFDNAYLFSDIAKREIASILRCDISLIISTYEMELLQNVFKIEAQLLHYIPFLLDKITDELELTPNFQERENFYFVGNFLHNPNYDAVVYLKNKIWPELSKKLPKASLYIYGAYPSQKVTQLHNERERFLIKGRAENLNQIIQNKKICLAPIRFGAGIKGKFIESIQNGTPSVTTTIGAEAMHDNLEWSGIIANSPDKIINAAVKLYSDEKLWKKSQQNGIVIINKRYDKLIFTKRLIYKIITTQENLNEHRANNFIGSILQHHTLKSTKYLSKWIESKNAK